MSKFKFDLSKLNVKLIGDLVVLAGAGLSVYYLLNTIMNELYSSGGGKEQHQKGNTVLKKLQKVNPHLKKVTFNQYEKALLGSLVVPEDINVTFSDVGGLETIIDELKETVILPLVEPELFAAHLSLIKSPKGVLFHGPPGCGKTMLAKAIAKESGAFFLLIRMSTIMDKWYGESNKIVDAIFSLANKLQPCIIFIDEIDSFLRDRSSNDHEVSAVIKAEFMTLWDGLKANGRIIVMGATNRKDDIDAAFLRRLPKTFAVSKPNYTQRKSILSKILKDAETDDDDFDLDALVSLTRGYSGSDLMEMCREAAILPVREYIRENYKGGKLNKDENDNMPVRALRTSDFVSTALPSSSID